MSKVIPFAVFFLFFILTYYFGQYLSASDNKAEHEIYLNTGKCNPAVSVCGVVFENAKFNIGFVQPPSALQPFEVKVEVLNLDAEKVSVSFMMEKMDMGMNIFYLKKHANDTWSGDVVLPVCSLGRNDWRVELRVKDGNKILRADFKFEVN